MMATKMKKCNMAGFIFLLLLVNGIGVGVGIGLRTMKTTVLARCMEDFGQDNVFLGQKQLS